MKKLKKFSLIIRKNVLVGFSIIFFAIIGYVSIKENKEQKKIKLANQFNDNNNKF